MNKASRENFLEGKEMYIGNGVSGVIIGTLDALATGLPILTIGIPFYESVQGLIVREYLQNHGISFESSFTVKEIISGKLVYAMSAAIPVIIKYHDEIINYLGR